MKRLYVSSCVGSSSPPSELTYRRAPSCERTALSGRRSTGIVRPTGVTTRPSGSTAVPFSRGPVVSRPAGDCITRGSCGSSVPASAGTRELAAVTASSSAASTNPQRRRRTGRDPTDKWTKRPYWGVARPLSAVVPRLARAGCVAAEDEANVLVTAAPDDATLESWITRREVGEPL